MTLSDCTPDAISASTASALAEVCAVVASRVSEYVNVRTASESGDVGGWAAIAFLAAGLCSSLMNDSGLRVFSGVVRTTSPVRLLMMCIVLSDEWMSMKYTKGSEGSMNVTKTRGPLAEAAGWLLREQPVQVVAGMARRRRMTVAARKRTARG